MRSVLPTIIVLFVALSGYFFLGPKIAPVLSSVGPAVSQAQSVPVLLYHGEGTAAGEVPIAVFTDQMQTLKLEGWHTITLPQFSAFMKGEGRVPDKSFVLTFDDGRKDTYYPVDPVLKNLGFTAIMFVITGFSMPDNGHASDFYLSRTELQTMANSGRWELESHGKEDHRIYPIRPVARATTTTPGHFVSNTFWLTAQNRYETDDEFTSRVAHDLALAKQTLQQNFGAPVIAYAYPYNDFGQDTVNFPESKQLLARIVPSLYTFAFYQTWPGNGDTFNYPDPAQYLIKRIEPGTDWSGQKLLRVLEDGRAKTLPYAGSRFGEDWLGAWGDITRGDALALQATPDTTGAMALLNGSGLWRDYTFTAVFNWKSGKEIALIARHHDDGNYFTCAFSNGTAYLEEHKNGVQRELASAPYSLSSAHNDVTVGMSARGANVSCVSNGIPITHVVSNDPDVQRGGVGLAVWDKTPGMARADVLGVDVKL